MYLLAMITAATTSLTPIPPRDTTLEIAPGTTVAVSSLAQPIVVTGTSGTRLTVRGASVDLSQRRIEINGQIFSRGPKGPIMIEVPTSVRLRIDAVSGPVTVTNAPDHLEIDAVDGPVQITGGQGEIIVSATGEISVTDFRGTHLGIDGLAGSITVRGASGSIEIENVNGPILLEHITSRDVQVSSVNGQVRWRSDFDPAGRYVIDSHNGGIELWVPASLNAKLRIETFNGGFSSELPARVTGDDRDRSSLPTERDITATYGRGQASIDITTFNGGVQVRKFGGA